ncbi:MAG: metallophosphoesterase [Deltaproteobacteria bacterium]|nr:metallophosphoesterase [Deltaproteobacteria bacterium]
MSLAFLFVPAIYLVANIYLYGWLVRMAGPSAGLRWFFRLALFSLVVLYPIGKTLGRHDFNSYTYLLAYLSSVWMGISFFLILLALASDLLRSLCRRVSCAPEIMARPTFGQKRFLAGLLVAGALFTAGGAMWEARQLGVTWIDIPLKGLPPEMDGFSIVHLSDVHYGMIMENSRFSEIVGRVNQLQPDLVVFTGDLVDAGVSHMEEMAVPLSGLKARYGVLAVVGNHEYFAGVKRAVRIMEQAGIIVLRNQLAHVAGLQILGIDDPTGYRRMGEPEPDFPPLLGAVDPKRPSIFLYHPPEHFEEAARAGIGLQLSGHTHGAQFLPIRPISRLLYPRFRGLYQIDDSYLYVSRGVGTGGPPMRQGSPPEIVYLKLRATSP